MNFLEYPDFFSIFDYFVNYNCLLQSFLKTV